MRGLQLDIDLNDLGNGLFRKQMVPTPLCFECLRGRVGYRIPRCIVKCKAQRPDLRKYILKA
jgi:hypothetical protein